MVNLEELPLFKGMSLAQLELLRPLFVPYECYEGTVLFEQNEPAEFLYLVITGEMMIQYKPDDGPALTVARVRPGGLVGWSALIGRRFYTSAVMCTTHATMLRVNGADLQKLCEQDPKTGVLVLERLADVIAERLRNTQPQVLSLLEKSIRSGLKC
ncbi:MAG TPA: cyclic nucleotide-binding domain-containing protein [Anaerolineales bacterium]|nr:cyclic nucleotide-binding domain-containing protein [Anaerolineales bacterium]